jgi:hypothetical protein
VKHKTELLDQIHSKEADKVHERKAFFEEGIKLDQEAKARQQHIEDIKLRKIAELQVSNTFVLTIRSLAMTSLSCLRRCSPLFLSFPVPFFFVCYI